MINAAIFAALVEVMDAENEREEMRSADGGKWGITGKKQESGEGEGIHREMERIKG